MDDSFLFRCPACDAKLMVSETRRGQQVQCPKCMEDMIMPSKPTHPGSALDVERAEDVEVSDLDRPNTNNSGRSPEPESRFGFQCPFCQSKSPPLIKKQISTAGWIVFVGLVIACFPLSLIGLFIKEEYRVCGSCGIKLG